LNQFPAAVPAAAARRTDQLAGIAIVVLAVAALMALHAPGHMSYDSLVQLDEGFNRRYYSWNPPSFSLFLGATYALFGSTNAALLISQSLLVVAAYRLAAAPSAPIAMRLTALLSVLVVPIVFIYAGIVWKDVFFAHLALMGFAVLQRDRVERRHLFAAALLLGAAATVRQQGIVLIVPLLGYSLWLATNNGAGRAIGRLPLAIVALAGFSGGYALIDAIVRTTAQELPAKPYATGVQLLQYYDIAGMAYRDPEIKLDEFAALPDFDRARFLRFVRRGYSPERIDYMETVEKDFTHQFNLGPEGDRVIGRQWRSVVMGNPLTYVAHRAEVFRWMLGRHDPLKCGPFLDLISPEPPGVAERYGLEPGFHPIAHRLTRAVSIAAFRPYLFLEGGALATFALLLWRWVQSRRRDLSRSRAASQGVIPALYAAGLIYALLHFNVGVACDFRYLYFPVLASIVTMAHVLWLAFAQVFGAGDSPSVGT